jgi:hypothetical protein
VVDAPELSGLCPGSAPAFGVESPGEIYQQCRRAEPDKGNDEEDEAGSAPILAPGVDQQSDQDGAGDDEVIRQHDQGHPVRADRVSKMVERGAETARLLYPLRNGVELPKQEQGRTGKQGTRKEAAHA